MNTAQQIQMGFEVGDLDKDVADVTHRVAVITDEDGEPVSGFVIVGKNSKAYQDAATVVRVNNIQRAAKRNKQVDSSTPEGAAVIAKTVADNEHALALAVVTDWFGFNLEGAPMQFDRNVVDKMFRKFPQWQLRVNAALDNDANFMKV